jgi:hypothetical protein
VQLDVEQDLGTLLKVLRWGEKCSGVIHKKVGHSLRAQGIEHSAKHSVDLKIGKDFKPVRGDV